MWKIGENINDNLQKKDKNRIKKCNLIILELGQNKMRLAKIYLETREKLAYIK